MSNFNEFQAEKGQKAEKMEAKQVGVVARPISSKFIYIYVTFAVDNVVHGQWGVKCNLQPERMMKD